MTIPASINNPPMAVRNPQAEALLDEMGFEWRLDLIRIDSIDRERSLANQARFTPLDTEYVETLVRAGEAGAIYPAIIVGINGQKGSKCITADGNHRREMALTLERELIWAYVAEYDDFDQFLSLSYIANSRLNGRPNSLEEKVAHAASFVDKGVPKNAAAIQCGVSPRQIDTYRGARTARERFKRLGIGDRSFSSVTDSALVHISGAAADGAVRDALRLHADGVTVAQVCKLMRDASVGKLTEEEKGSAQIRALKAMGEQASKTTAAALTPHNRSRKRMLDVRLLGCLKTIEEAQEKAPEHDEILARIKDMFR